MCCSSPLQKFTISCSVFVNHKKLYVRHKNKGDEGIVIKNPTYRCFKRRGKLSADITKNQCCKRVKGRWEFCFWPKSIQAFPLWYAVHLETESEHQVLNGNHIFAYFTRILLLFGIKFQYSHKRRQDEEGKQSDKAAIRDLVLAFCPTMHCVQQRKLKFLVPA